MDLQRHFRDVFLNVVRTGPLRAHVSAAQLDGWLPAAWPHLLVGGVLDTRPLFQWLLSQPRVELMDVARALIFLKSRERYLHLTVRLPSLLESMPVTTQVELLAMVQRQGVHSGVTDPGLL